MRARANGAARVLRRVAIVGEYADRFAGCAIDRLAEALKLSQLVLRERLGRKEIQRAARWVLQNRVQHRRVVAERLARRGRRDDDDVPMRKRVVDRAGLVRVELLDPARPQRPRQSRVERGREWRILRGNRGQPADSGDVVIGGVGPDIVHRGKSRREPVESLFECGGAR